MARISNGSLWLQKNCLTFDIQDAEDLNAFSEFKASYGKLIREGKKMPTKVKRHIYKLYFDNINPDVQIGGYDIHSDYENYFIGNDPSKWASDVKKFSYIIYKNLYPGIDFKIYGSNGFLKWDFIINPSANPAKIKTHYEGIENTSLSKGNLILKTNIGKILEMKPDAWQYNEMGEKIAVDCEFKLSKNKLEYKVRDYKSDKLLIIDPTLVYASYTGSTADNWGYTATYDLSGNIFAGGSVFQNGQYPLTIGALDSTFNGGNCDIGITKFDPNSSQLIYSTYLGGSGSEVPSSLVVNSANELLILATTGSVNYPTTPNAFDTTFSGGTNITLTSIIDFNNGSDIAITRLSNSGNQILSSTYFGGNGNDGMNSATILDYNYADMIRGEILTDNNNNVLVVSSTNSTNLPTNSNSFQPVYAGNQDGVVVKFDNNLSNKIWCSYLGGTSADALYSISLFKNEDLVVTGGTRSTNLLTTNGVLYPGYQGGPADGYVATLNKYGNQIYALSYYGSTGFDQSFFVDTDRKDNVYLYGQTNDTTGVFHYNALWQTAKGGQFVSKLSKNLNSIVWSTNWGTSITRSTLESPSDPDISPSAFMVDLCSRVYMSGWGGWTNYFGTTSGLPVTPNAFQSTTDGSDYYFITLKDDASALDYATFYGGTLSHEHVDGGTSRFDNTGKLYQSVCAGCGGNNDFPTTTGCHSSTNNSGNCNNGILKFSFNLPVIIADFATPQVGCAPFQISFNNTSYITSTSAYCHWNFGNGNTSTACNPVYTYSQGGIYNVELIVSDTSSCNLADTIVKQVVVIEGQRDTLAPKEICIGDFVQIGLLPIYFPNLTYQWNNAASLSNASICNPIASPTASTWYTLLFSNGICTDTLVQLVKVLNIDADAGNDTTLCFSNITLIASSNYPNLNFHWSSNSSFTDTLNNSFADSTLTTTITGNTYYYIKVFSTNACYNIDSVLIEPRLIINPNQIQNPKCSGDSNGFINLLVGGGVQPYNYQWNTGQSSLSINGLTAGIYKVTVTDIDGCFAQESFTLIDPAPLLSQTSVKNIPCQSACIGEAWSTPTGGTTPYHWQWNDSQSQTTNPAANLCDGTYMVTITDANLCARLDTVTIIDSSIYIVPNAYVTDDTIYEGEVTQIMSNYFGSTYHYSWHPTTGLNNSTIYNPKASPTTSTTYYLTVTDQNGCSWTDSVFIYVIDVICEEPYIFVPNAFTPNGDGRNDVLYVRSSVGYEMLFRIYNRWGELIFESKDVNNGWDGTYKGKKLEPGVFDYYLSFTCYNHQIFEKKGNITLIR